MCPENRLMKGTTVFHHKTIHKLRWVSPNRRTRNHTDHITISQKWSQSMKDVKRGKCKQQSPSFAVQAATEAGSPCLAEQTATELESKTTKNCEQLFHLKQTEKPCSEVEQLFYSSPLKNSAVKSQFAPKLTKQVPSPRTYTRAGIHEGPLSLLKGP